MSYNTASSICQPQTRQILCSEKSPQGCYPSQLSYRDPQLAAKQHHLDIKAPSPSPLPRRRSLVLFPFWVQSHTTVSWWSPTVRHILGFLQTFHIPPRKAGCEILPSYVPLFPLSSPDSLKFTTVFYWNFGSKTKKLRLFINNQAWNLLFLFLTEKGRERRGFLLHLFHNLASGNFIVGSHCTCPTENLTVFGRNHLILFQRAKYLPGLSQNCLGCQMSAKLLEGSHLYLTGTIEGKCTEVQ